MLNGVADSSESSSLSKLGRCYEKAHEVT